MGIDRSKFKASSVTKMQEKDSQLSSAMGMKSNRAGMLDITPGKNVFRIYPGHPDENLPDDDQPGFSQPSVKTFLPMMVDEIDKDTKKPTGKKREGSKPLFNSRIHGDTPKDLVEEYIKLARKAADENYGDDKVEKQKYLDKIYGKFSPIATERIMGIGYKTAHVMYANKIVGDVKTFGRLEVKDSVKTRMNAIAAEESAGEAMGIDPYTDLDDGRAIVINYDKTAKAAALYYITNLDTDYDKASKQIKMYPIDDAQLTEFDKQPTLLSMYVKVFGRKDFELQVEGLDFFDTKNKMGICDTEQWQTVLTEIDSYYPDLVKVEETEKEEPEEADEILDEDEFSSMSRIQLKTYIAKNSLGIVIKPSFSDDVIREKIRESLEELSKEINEPEEPEEVEEVVEQVPEKSAAARSSNRLSALRNKK
jgi:hypothetical protein